MQSSFFINISAYKFIRLDLLPLLQADLNAFLIDCGVKGTILLADEGINIALAGRDRQIRRSLDWFADDSRFSDIQFKQSRSSILPFSKLKVKIRREIIGFGQPDIDPEKNPAPYLSAQELKRWLDEGKPFTLLDTRNRYEVESGTFETAISLDMDNFKEFSERVSDHPDIDPNVPVVTFCTGGVRCEKAAPWMLQNGFNEVYQVDGGILRYFENCGNIHWKGDCFVFDDRVELDPKLAETGSVLCKNCHRAVSAAQQLLSSYIVNESCPTCHHDNRVAAEMV